MSTEQQFTVTAENIGQRLDVFCVTHFPGFSRAVLQKAIKEGRITVNGKVAKPKYAVQARDCIASSMATETVDKTVPMASIELPIIYEDKDVVVINKPAGIMVHPAAHAPQRQVMATVADWFRDRYTDVMGVGEDPSRPGIVHRLDRDTSGVLILAKTATAYEFLKDQWKRHHVKKEYLALVFGIPTGTDGRVNRALARSPRNPRRRTIDPQGKEAITEWQLEVKLKDAFSLLRVQPLTGRTHQIRVHMHFIGHPIVGDVLYTFKRQKPPTGVKRQLLHAEKLTLNLPTAGRKTFVAPLAADFRLVLHGLGYDDVP